MQFHLIVVSSSVADPGEVAPKGPQFFFGDWASLLSQGLDKHSATDSSIHETVVRNPIDLSRGRPQVIQIPSGLPLPSSGSKNSRGEMCCLCNTVSSANG